MAYCLAKPLAKKFKEMLKSGEIHPEKLNKMTSLERHDFFSKFLGEANALNVNSLFESKLLLKNRQLGMINWAKQVTGIKPEVRRDLLSRIEKYDKILSPTEEKKFLKGLAEKRLGVSIEADEAKSIMELANKVKETREALKSGTGDRFEYGASYKALKDYVGDLKSRALGLEPVEYLNPLTSIKEVAGLSKSLKATLDMSLTLRQGIKMFYSHPIIWTKGTGEGFRAFGRALMGKDATKLVEIDVFSRPGALTGKYKDGKLDIGLEEESFRTPFLGKIPVLGRLYKASEGAYKAAALRMRADIFDTMIESAEKAGVDFTDKKMFRDYGKLANSMTGRGGLGSLEHVSEKTNLIFFSVKFLKSNFDFLTAHLFDTKMSRRAKRIAATNLIKVIGGVATTLGIANTLYPGSVEWDPRSSDFGTIRIGDTRFDITGGMKSLVTLASRIVPGVVGTVTGQGWKNYTKSSTTGELRELGTGFGQQTGMELIYKTLLDNKYSPIAGMIKDMINGTDFQGDPLTAGGVASNLLVPLPISNFIETLKNPNAAPLLLTTLSDFFGISTQTYGDKRTEFEKAESERTEESAKAREDFQGEFDRIQAVKAEQGQEAANIEVKKLTLEDYETYKKMKTIVKTKRTNELKEEIYPIYKEAQEIKATSGQSAANEFIKGKLTSEEEYHAYELLKDAEY